MSRPDHSPYLSALDRCEHGRHAADNCGGCPGGQSTGNLFLAEGVRIGTTLRGDPIVVPPNADFQRSHPDRWVPSSTQPGTFK